MVQKVLGRFQFFKDNNVSEIRYHNKCRLKYSVADNKPSNPVSMKSTQDKLYTIGRYILDHPDLKRFNLTNIFDEIEFSYIYLLKKELFLKTQ